MTSAAAQELGPSNAPAANTEDTYWAAADSRTAAREASTRILRTAGFSDTSGRLARWIRALRMHYGQDNWYGPNVGSELRPGGEAGELLMLRGNHWRNFALHIVNTVTQDVLAFDTVASDTGSQGRAANELAHDVLADLVRRQKWDYLVRLGAEWSTVCDSAAFVGTWDFFGGEEGMPNPDGSPGRKGDVLFEVFGPHDVFFDLRCTRPEPDWYILRRWVNRWDLVAQFPELREKILSYSTRERGEAAFAPLWTAATVKSDEIAVFELRHRKTMALPNGRLMRFCDEECVFVSMELPYDDVQVHMVSAGPFLDSSASFTSMYDILAMQEGYDAGLSALLSTMDQAGIQNWMVDQDSNLTVESLGGSARLVKTNFDASKGPGGGRPELMPQPQVSAAAVEVLKMFPTVMGTLVGVNEVTRGAPPDQVKAGNYAALLAQQTASFWTPLRRSLVAAVEGMATDALKMFARYATQDRTIEIEGDEKGSRIRSFLGADLKAVRRVAVTIANPMTQTPAGRAMLADNLAKFGWVTRTGYIDAITTGKVDELVDPDEAKLNLVKWENEQMLRWAGDTSTPEALHSEMAAKLPVMPSDDDAFHLEHHAMVMDDPSARLNPVVAAINTAHCGWHQQQMAMKMGTGAPMPAPKKKTPGTEPASSGKGEPPPPDAGNNPQAQNAGVKPPAPAAPPPGAQNGAGAPPAA